MQSQPAPTLRTSRSKPQVDFKYDSTPNAAKLIDSLRFLNYDDLSACLDISDNSVDAGAPKIWFEISGADQRRDIQRILIADNGRGMNRDCLGQAIRLGSDVPHEVSSDLGRFGMGLCTASLSLAKRTTVITRNGDGITLKAINDVEAVKNANQFVSYLSEADADDVALLNRFVGEGTGTIVVLENLDGLQHSKVGHFENRLIKEVGRVYRHFIDAKREFFVNGTLVQAVDPLEWANSETQRFDDSDLPISYTPADGVERKETVHVRIALVAEDRNESDERRSMKNQGFYIVRNNREIASADTLGIFTKHNYLNRFRGEIRLSGNLDAAFKVGIKKNGVQPIQSVFDQLDAYLRPQVMTIQNRVKRDTRTDVSSDITAIHQDAASEIRKKSNLLLTPTADHERRGSRTAQGGEKSADRESERQREPRDSRQSGLSDRVRFETCSMGEGGVIFDAQMQGRTVIVQWNADHPFYKRFVLDIASERRVVAGVDYLLYCWAAAELKYAGSGDEAFELLTNLKSEMSSNLRVLLK